VTIDGTLLRPGDIIEINGLLVIEDYNSTDTLDLQIHAGDIDSAETLLLFHTGDMSLVNDRDYLRFCIRIRVVVGGASGTVMWETLAHTNIAGTVALQASTIEDGTKLAGDALNMSDDITFKAQGDYSVSNADNESQIFWDVRVIKGAKTTT